MKVQTLNNVNFKAQFDSYPKKDRAAIKNYCEYPVQKIENAQKTSLMAYDCFTKDEEIKGKLEQIPEGLVNLVPYGIEDKEFEGILEIKPTQLDYVSEEPLKSFDDIPTLELKTPEETLVKTQINQWLDSILNCFKR